MKRLVVIFALLAVSAASASCIYSGPGSSGGNVPANASTPTASPSPVSDLDAARDAGQAYVGRMADLYFPKWRRAVYGEPRVYQDLQGNTAAYLFPFARDGQMLGYVVVASGRYGHSVLEVKTDAMPQVTPLNGVDPHRLVYLGFDQHYAIYRVDGSEVALNLKTKEESDVSHLRFGLRQDGIDEWDREKAKEVMQTERARAIGRGAELAEPLPLYDLDGNVRAYWFRFMEGEREVPAYVVVGNWLYDYRALRVWTKGDLSPIYFPPSAAEVRSAIEKDLGLSLKEGDVAQAVTMLYFWPSSLWTVYDVSGQEIAVEMSTMKAALVSRLRAVSRGENLEEDIAHAAEVAQGLLISSAQHERYRDLLGSQVQKHRVYRDWEGEVNSYYFVVVNDGTIMGDMVIGSLLHGHKALTFSTRGPDSDRPFRTRESPPKQEAVAMLGKALGLDIEESDVGDPVRFEFGGPTYHLAYYEIREEVVGIVIGHGQAFRVWDMRTSSGLL